jgi:predicted lipoprotein with Yx(FWY)xxD motif
MCPTSYKMSPSLARANRNRVLVLANRIQQSYSELGILPVACTGGCPSNWPPLLATSGTPTSDPALPGQLTALNGANGSQVVDNGHPLYTFSKDSASGDANGQGIGRKWFAATPGLAAAAASTSEAPPSC